MEWNFNGMVARKAEPEPCAVSPCAIKRAEDDSFYSTRSGCSCAAFVSLGGRATQTQSCICSPWKKRSGFDEAKEASWSLLWLGLFHSDCLVMHLIVFTVLVCVVEPSVGVGGCQGT